MIVRYVIRDNIENNHVFCSFTGVPYNAVHDDLLSALKEARRIMSECVSVKGKLFITRNEYANEARLRQDFEISSKIEWSDWFHGVVVLERMITRLENNK